jgi:hypothetical protein
MKQSWLECHAASGKRSWFVVLAQRVESGSEAACSKRDQAHISRQHQVSNLKQGLWSSTSIAECAHVLRTQPCWLTPSLSQLTLQNKQRFNTKEAV